MPAMQGSPGENEQGASERPRYIQEATGEILVQVAAVVGVAIGITLLKLYRNEDGARLQALHGILTLLQNGARLLGEAAIKVEKAYNETAESYG